VVPNPSLMQVRRVDHRSRRNGAASAVTTKRVPEQTKKRKAANARPRSSVGRATTRGRASRQQLPGVQVSPEATGQPSRAKVPRTFSAPRRRTLVIRAASRSSVRRPFARASLDAMHGRCVLAPGGSARHCDELRRPRTAAWPANRRRDAERRRTQARRHEFPCRTLLVRTIGYSNHMSGIGDRAEAEGTELKGKAKEAAGRAAGDPGLRARGEVDQARGKSKSLIGRIKTFLARR
jgi:uncharacterized protein YjbJ (UPF0337 family)